MTEIKPTEREPLCDIEAQAIALHDPDHPKRAVWLSLADARRYDLECNERIKRLDLETGSFYGSAHDCGRLEDDPSEEMLAELLDYTEPKSAIWARPAQYWLVVQARDAQDCVVWEQVASWEGLEDAKYRARVYGRLQIHTMDDVLKRRAALISLEEDRAARGG